MKTGKVENEGTGEEKEAVPKNLAGFQVIKISEKRRSQGRTGGKLAEVLFHEF